MITVNELFAGIGAFRMALRRLNIPHEIVGMSEIDKYAIKSYEAIYGRTRNYGDISKVYKLDYADLWTYGFPCQDISLAGQQKGIVKGETRSGLLYEVQRLLLTATIHSELPKYLILENVKNLVSKKFKADFDSWLKWLDDMGYNNYWKVLNAKDYGVPQNRERVFVVSIRKDVDNGAFEFPEGFPLEKRLKDLLEETVDEKYYLSNNGVSGIINALTDGREHKPSLLSKDTDYAPTIDTMVGAQTHRSPYIEETTNKVMQLGNCRPTKTRANPNQGRIYDIDGIAPCLNQMGGGNREPHIVESKVLVHEPKIEVLGNYSPSGHDASRIVSADGLAPTVKENHGTVTAVVEPLIQKIDIPQVVKVRKYPVDCNLLCECLRDYKSASNFSCKEIAEMLNVPMTKVEHWFRQDECFAIPDAELWFGLKELLGIETDEFDEAIMTFEEKEGVFEKSERHYFADGIAPTLTSATASEKIIEPTSRIRKLTPKECFRLMGFKDEEFAKAEKVNSNTQLYKQAGNSIVVDVLVAIFKELLVPKKTRREWLNELLGGA